MYIEPKAIVDFLIFLCVVGLGAVAMDWLVSVKDDDNA